ncbi:hypothetical protein SBADM41S_06417 [Streptomyces badius]
MRTRRPPAARRTGRRLGGGRARRPGVRVDDDPGETEALLADLDQLIQRLADLGLGGGALEEREGLTGDDGENGRHTLDAELLHQHLVGVDVDLGQQEAAVVLDGQALQQGAQLLARLAPLGPEVDDDGDLGGAMEDIALETGFIDVDHQGGGRHGADAPGAGGLRAGLLRLGLGLSGRLDRGEVDNAAHGHVPRLHTYILPRERSAAKSERENRPGPGPPPACGGVRTGTAAGP